MYQPLADGGAAVAVPALVESADWRALGPVRRGVARIALLASSNSTCGVPGYVWGKTLDHEPIKNALPIELRDVYTQEQFTALRRDMENLVQCQCGGEDSDRTSSRPASVWARAILRMHVAHCRSQFVLDHVLPCHFPSLTARDRLSVRAGHLFSGACRWLSARRPHLSVSSSVSHGRTVAS